MSATRVEQALILADAASRRRLSPEEAALLRRRIRELAARAGAHLAHRNNTPKDTT